MRTTARYLMALAVLAGLGSGVLWALPTPAHALTQAQTALRTGDVANADALATSVSALCLWALLGWLAVLATGTAALAIPGTLGRIAAVISSTIAPRAARHMMATVLGVTLLTGIVATGPAHAEASTHADPRPSYSLNLDWPVSGQQPPATQAAAPPNSSGGAATVASSYEQVPTPAHANAPQTPQNPDTVTVADGDNLWSITSKHLGPNASPERIAQEWPLWWEANRDVIGEDPDLIQPGQSLRAPD